MLLWHTDIEGTEGIEGTEEGGNLALPAIAAVILGAGWLVDTIVDVYEMSLEEERYVNEQRIQNERNDETDRYWSDYEKNTGVVPLYPYRAGSFVDYVGSALTANQGIVDLYRSAKRKFLS